MCGRFSLTLDPVYLQQAFPDFIFPQTLAPRYNVAPSQPILAVANTGTNKADFFTWGLIPSWAKDTSIGSKMINARAETLSEKPSFRNAFKFRRCIILADGFFEWKTVPGQKSRLPHFIHMRDGKPFAFAGLWERWQPPEGSEVLSTTIITTSPNDLVANIHTRMPVILPKDAYAQWLDPAPANQLDLQSLLVPYPANEMEMIQVSSYINSPINNSPQAIQPIS